MTDKKQDRFIIVGGGIGGLAAALGLAQHGIKSIVLEKSSKLNKIIQNNLILAKHVGRIGNILKSKKIDNNTIEILSQNEKISLNFNENIDLASQKIRISQKIENLNKQINALENKLKNKAYVNNAPKEIVQNDKKLLQQLTIEDGKLRSIVSSIN